MWFKDDLDNYDAKPIWNIFQFSLAILCTLNVTAFSKIPLDHFFGSGWALIQFILFLVLFSVPLIYLQLRLGCQYKRGILSLFEQFFPLSIGFGIGSFVRHMISMIYVSGLMSQALSYIFFTFYNCDSTFCIGASYMWGSCENEWQEGDCIEGSQLVYRNPTAEEQFYLRYVMQRTASIDQSREFPRWYEKQGLNTVPLIITWILIGALVMTGARIFGWILYFVAPIALILLISVVITFHANYADASGQKSLYTKRYYENFASTIPIADNFWDQFQFEPMVWGLISTYVHLSISSGLWSGSFPIMGKWMGESLFKKHLSWIIVVVIIGLTQQLPTILTAHALASSYSIDYARCYVSFDWAVPFVVMPHVFSKFSSYKILPFVYYLSYFLFLLISQSFLLIVVFESALDYLTRHYQSVERHVGRCYRIGVALSIVILFPLSFTTAIRSGFYWITLIDHYIDRGMFLIVIGQSIGFVFAFARSKRIERPVLKIFALIFEGVFHAISVIAFIWYVTNTTSPRPDFQCSHEYQTQGEVTIPERYHVVGWLIAFAPFVIGVPIGLIMSCCRFRGKRPKECCSFLVRGDIPDPSEPFTTSSNLGGSSASTSSTVLNSNRYVPKPLPTLASHHRIPAAAYEIPNRTAEDYYTSRPISNGYHSSRTNHRTVGNNNHYPMRNIPAYHNRTVTSDI